MAKNRTHTGNYDTSDVTADHDIPVSLVRRKMTTVKSLGRTTVIPGRQGVF